MLGNDKITKLNGIYTPVSGANADGKKRAKGQRKNRSEFSNKQDQQYKISIHRYDDHLKTKAERATVYKQIQGEWCTSHGFSCANLKQKLKNPKNRSAFMGSHAMKICYRGGLGDFTPYLVLATQGIQADFLYIDLDNSYKDEEGNKVDLKVSDDGHLSFEKAKEILDESGYNYVLSTSASHGESAQHKLHVLIAVHRPISDPNVYKIYRTVAKRMFEDAGYFVDDAASSFANFKNAGAPGKTRVAVQFDEWDFRLTDQEIEALQTYNKPSWAKKQRGGRSGTSNIPYDHLCAYENQINNMFGMTVDKDSSRTSGLKIYRDEFDKGPGVFCAPYSEGFDPRMIFDNQTKANGSRYEYMSFFSLDDYMECVEPEGVRLDLQANIRKAIENWMHESGYGHRIHKYLVTNEGLGKSSTIISLAEMGMSFIYAFCQNDGVKEKSEKMTELGIDHSVVKAAHIVLEDEGFKFLSKECKRFFKENSEPSLRGFLAEKVEDGTITEENKASLLAAYDTNNNLINSRGVVLMTTAKLKIMLKVGQAEIWKNPKHIIIDEFVVGEWHDWVIDKPDDVEKATSKVMKTWDKGEGAFPLYKQDSLFKLLARKKVLVLTTEKKLADMTFAGSDYTSLRAVSYKAVARDDELAWDKVDEGNFVRKLKADNVHIWLVSSTRKTDDYREKMLSVFKKINAEIICDGVKGNPHRATLTNLGVKGMDNLKDEDTVVFGTLATESVLKELFVNNKEYLAEEFGDEAWGKMVGPRYPEDLERELIIASQDYLNNVLMETAVSQSVGRNSGFRFVGQKCLIILPVLNARSARRLRRDIDLNYVTENVKAVNFDVETLTFSRIKDFKTGETWRGRA